MLVQIRKELSDKFQFSTDDGIEIDPNEVYEARYNEEKNDDFEILVNGEYRSIEGIDFEIKPSPIK